MVTVDANSGETVESKACIPRDFDIDQDPADPTEGFGLDASMTPADYRSLKGRFLEISSIVWQIFAIGSTSLDSRNVELVREYRSIFRRITKTPLTPYYEAVASDFIPWLDEVLS
jgi:hypothetical protein